MRNRIEIDEFRQLVYKIVSMVPHGRATSYGAIAKAIGHPTQSRLVGRVMAGCSESDEKVPAHRVVNSQGILSGCEAFETPTTMADLLETEGVVVEGNRIKKWCKVFWNPMDEILMDE